MPLTGDIIYQNDLARRDNTGFAIAGRELRAGVQIDDVLAAGGRVPVQVIIARRFTENNARRGQGRGIFAEISFRLPLDLYIAKMRLAMLVFV